jgi:hypothetical protein
MAENDLIEDVKHACLRALTAQIAACKLVEPPGGGVQ